MQQLGQLEEGAHSPVVMISQDSFYKDLSAEQREAANDGEYNFDHPGEIRGGRPAGRATRSEL